VCDDVRWTERRYESTLVRLVFPFFCTWRCLGRGYSCIFWRLQCLWDVLGLTSDHLRCVFGCVFRCRMRGGRCGCGHVREPCLRDYGGPVREDSSSCLIRVEAVSFSSGQSVPLPWLVGRMLSVETTTTISSAGVLCDRVSCILLRCVVPPVSLSANIPGVEPE